VDVRRKHPAFETASEVTSPLPPAPGVPSLSTRAPFLRTLALVAAVCTGLAGVITATGAAIVSIIDAWAETSARRTNAEIDRRLDAMEKRVNGDFGLTLETTTRQKKEVETADEIDRLKSRVRTLERER
jgi:HAMP domain-containing protein